jgi:diacylglycerol kinase (ATP)
MEKNKGVTRLYHAFIYSWQGLKSAIRNEAAFQQELILLITVIGISLFFDITPIERLAMIVSVMLILLVELLNSAIECVVDRIGPEHHILSGRAKDYGSLAVLLSLIIAVSTWVVILLD